RRVGGPREAGRSPHAEHAKRDRIRERGDAGEGVRKMRQGVSPGFGTRERASKTRQGSRCPAPAPWGTQSEAGLRTGARKPGQGRHAKWDRVLRKMRQEVT